MFFVRHQRCVEPGGVLCLPALCFCWLSALVPLWSDWIGLLQPLLLFSLPAHCGLKFHHWGLQEGGIGTGEHFLEQVLSLPRDAQHSRVSVGLPKARNSTSVYFPGSYSQREAAPSGFLVIFCFTQTSNNYLKIILFIDFLFLFFFLWFLCVF